MTVADDFTQYTDIELVHLAHQLRIHAEDAAHLKAALIELGKREKKIMGDEPGCDQKDKGIYDKFRVYRTDGSDNTRKDKHWECDYFVLDLTHDRFAVAAIAAYASVCRPKGYVHLADDLNTKVSEMIRRFSGLEIKNERETGDPKVDTEL